MSEKRIAVAVIGAGPAGLMAAETLNADPKGGVGTGLRGKAFSWSQVSDGGTGWAQYHPLRTP